MRIQRLFDHNDTVRDGPSVGCITTCSLHKAEQHTIQRRATTIEEPFKMFNPFTPDITKYFPKFQTG